jgi:iron complex transport system substrate-binding protein
MVFVLASCGSPTAIAPTAEPTAVTIASTATAEPTIEPTANADAVQLRTVVDSSGRSVEIPATITAVISLAPSTTEIVYALGRGDSMRAVDIYSDYPEQVADLTKITNYDMSVNYEQITALAPDVVFAAAITAPEVIDQISQLGIPVVVVGSFASTFASIQQDIVLVGEVLNATAEAQQVVDTMATEWQALLDEVATYPDRPTVFWELDATDPGKPYTIGAGNFVHDLLVAAGGVNVFADADTPYPQVSVEQLVVANPDVILLADSLYGVTPEMVYAREGWGDIAAVANQRVYPINDSLVSRPGPRIVEGLAEVVALLHQQ